MRVCEEVVTRTSPNIVNLESIVWADGRSPTHGPNAQASHIMTSTGESIFALLPQSRPGLRISRDLIIGTVLGLTLTLSSAGLALWLSRPRWWTRGWQHEVTAPSENALSSRDEKSPIEIRSNDVVHGVLGLIGKRVHLSPVFGLLYNICSMLHQETPL